MAIKNKTYRQGEFVPDGAEPGLTLKFAWRDIEADKAVVDIAKARFNYPDVDHPNLQTFTNRPARQVGVRLNMQDNAQLYPDIVVIARPRDEVVSVAEVETRRSLRDPSEAELVEKWKAFAGVGSFYLFVPLLQVEEVRSIIKRHKIQVAGLRSWRYITGQDLMDVSEV